MSGMDKNFFSGGKSKFYLISSSLFFFSFLFFSFIFLFNSLLSPFLPSLSTLLVHFVVVVALLVFYCFFHCYACFYCCHVGKWAPWWSSIAKLAMPTCNHKIFFVIWTNLAILASIFIFAFKWHIEFNETRREWKRMEFFFKKKSKKTLQNDDNNKSQKNDLTMKVLCYLMLSLLI